MILHSLVKSVHVEFLEGSVQVMHVPQSPDRDGVKLPPDQIV